MEAVELGNWLMQNFSVTNALLSIIIVLIIVYLVKTSDLLRDKFQKRNSQSLQVEEYFRKVSGEELRDLLNSWLDKLNTKKIKNLLRMKPMILYNEQQLWRQSVQQQYWQQCCNIFT